MKKDVMVFMLVDCQRDFFSGGALAVPNADEIRPILAKITKLSKDNYIPLVKTMDFHKVNDPEFKVFPPHCIDGTEGQDSIEECLDYHTKNTVIFDKSTYDVFHPELGSPDIDMWLKKNKVTTCYVAGLVGNICVEAAVMGLLRRGIKVNVFENAVVWMDIPNGIFCQGPDNKELSIQRMRKAGANMAVAKL